MAKAKKNAEAASAATTEQAQPETIYIVGYDFPGGLPGGPSDPYAEEEPNRELETAHDLYLSKCKELEHDYFQRSTGGKLIDGIVYLLEETQGVRKVRKAHSFGGYAPEKIAKLIGQAFGPEVVQEVLGLLGSGEDGAVIIDSSTTEPADTEEPAVEASTDAPAEESTEAPVEQPEEQTTEA